MPDKIPQEEVEELLNDKPITLGEAAQIAIDTLQINKTYFEEFIRPELNPRPLLIKREGGKLKKLGALKILTSELNQVLARIKKEFKGI